MNIRNLALGLATALGGIVAIGVGAIALGRRQAECTPGNLGTDPADGPAPAREQRREVAPAGDEGHAAPDLAADAVPGERAPVAFRPDMDAPMTPAEREALRPAAGPSPTLVDAGTSLPAA